MRGTLSRSGLTLAMLLVMASPFAARAQTPPAQKAPAASAVAQAAPKMVAQRLPVPPAEKLVLLIRMSLLTLNDALQTGNFTVLRDRGSPNFRAANSAADLARIFTRLEVENVDLAMVAIMTPELTEAKVEGPEQRLTLKGVFPGQPMQIGFELAYEPVAGHWQLFGISVAPVLAQTSPAAAVASAPAKTAPSKTAPVKNAPAKAASAPKK